MIMHIGLDEAGRGALAGPVVAGAVCFGEDEGIERVLGKEGLGDSKKLTEGKREALFEVITEKCAWGVGVVEAADIDVIGIKKATHQAMTQALNHLMSQSSPNYQLPTTNYQPNYQLLVDGNDRFVFEYPSQDFIKGDESQPVISAASIIAKVWRDRLMKEYNEQYPGFGFADHKGYGAKSHLDLLDQEKYTPIHRKSYEPLKTRLVQGRLFQ